MAHTTLIGMAKVWPLMHGVKGINAAGGQIELQPGMPGWMPMQEAVDAEKAGTVQLMVGQTPQSLKKPTYKTVIIHHEMEDEPKPKRRAYRRSDTVAENK